MDTIKFDSSKTKIIVIGGNILSETEDSLYSFLAAGNRNYSGIATHIRFTKDRFIVCSKKRKVPNLPQSIALSEWKSMKEQVVPTTIGNHYCKFKDFLSICKNYQKQAVIILSHPIGIIEEKLIYKCIQENKMEQNILILSTEINDLIWFRNQSLILQLGLLNCQYNDNIIRLATKYHLILWFDKRNLSKELIDYCHSVTLEVGVQMINNPVEARIQVETGIDYLSTTILESTYDK